MHKEIDWLLKEKYDGEKSEAFFADVARLEAGEPLAYVIGHIPFLSTTIYLDSHPLIPRPETEFWVEKAIVEIKRHCLSQTKPASPQGNPRGISLGLPLVKVLDLCAGSGCIGVAIAKALPDVNVTFAEIEPAHLPTIRRNLRENTIINDSKQYEVICSNLFENIAGTFDFILTNPPYIDPALDRTEPSVRTYEPATALYGGKAGLELIEKILKGAKAHLKPNGQLWLEHEPEQVNELQQLAKSLGLALTTHTDQYNVPRYSIITVAQ